jgi:cation diffusion facilitator CzcD-associated flavoprotein CzcO
MTESPTVVILGAGVSGLCTGIQLLRAGISSFTILEKSDRVGGTWYDNQYPGAACDVPSHFYCYSFEPNPDWSRKFSGQAEI